MSGWSMGIGTRLRCGSFAVPLASALVTVLLLVGFAHSQGLQTSPYSAPSMLRCRAFAPANPLAAPAAPRGTDSVYLSSGMLHGLLGPVPNLEVGYLYSFGKRVRTGRLTLDYLLPVSLGPDSVVFGEAHTVFTDFWKTPSGSLNNRVDLSLGGGYRSMLNHKTLVGVNGFYDTSRLSGTWYSSGSLEFEIAALIAGNDAIDLNFNWYGNLLNRSVILNAFRTGPSNYDFQTGYSHELWNQGPDLRLSATGYRFDSGSPVYGVNAGAELKSRDGMFVLKYQVGNDKLNGTYQTVGAFVNVGLQLENFARGESPFTMPEPIFRSPRNLRRLLADKVKRDFHQAAPVVVSRIGSSSDEGGCSLPTTRFIADTGVLAPGSAHFLPWDGGSGVSPACLSKVSRIEITGYTVTPVSSCQMSASVRISDGSTNSTEFHAIYHKDKQDGPPRIFLVAAGEFASLNVSAEGLSVDVQELNPGCGCQITSMTITFYP